MPNSITIKANDGTLVLTGESSVINGGIVAVELEGLVLVSVGWGASPTHDGPAAVWDYWVEVSDWPAILVDGIRSGSLGKLANAVKAAATNAVQYDDRMASLWHDYVAFRVRAAA